jgi:hypothetical protein
MTSSRPFITSVLPAGDWAAYAAEISRRKETGNDTPT